MLDLAPKASGLDNLLAFPQAAFAALGSLGMDSGLDAALLGLGTIAVMWAGTSCVRNACASYPARCSA